MKETALVTVSRNHEKKFLSGGILEKMSKKFFLEILVIFEMTYKPIVKVFAKVNLKGLIRI